MSAYTMDAVWAPIVAEQREQVLAATWGHLAPRRNAVYRGRILWTVGIWDSGDLNPTVIYCELKSKTVGALDSSPWFYRAINSWLSKPQCDADHREDAPYKEGCVYEFSGYFRNYRFVGEIREVFNAKCISEKLRQSSCNLLSSSNSTPA